MNDFTELTLAGHISAYVALHDEYERAFQAQKEARVQADRLLHALQAEWQKLICTATHVSGWQGAYIVSDGRVLILGGGDYPVPLAMKQV